MGIWYIKKAEQIEETLTQEQNKLPMVLKKIFFWYKQLFCKCKIERVENLRTVCILPALRNKTIHQKERIIRKLQVMLYQEGIYDIVLDNELMLDEQWKNNLYAQNKNILDGRWLFQYVTLDMLEYVCQQRSIPLEKQNIAILVNQKTELVEETIQLFIKKVKSLKIITNHIQDFKKIETQLYEEQGMVISVVNNIKKSLAKSNLIINFDFPEELLKKYTIYRKAILFNIDSKVLTPSKRFEGIHVNGYQLTLQQDYIRLFQEYGLYDAFDSTILYESYLYRKDTFSNIRKDIEQDGTEISYLIGNKGPLDAQEYKRCV